MAGFLPKSDIPVLKPTELFEKRRQRDASKLKSYNKILEQIYIRIKASSREGADPWITYVVPPFILGLPKIDLEDCIVYIVYMLRSQTYEVRYTYPNLLYISWKHHEKEYILKGSPIMNAMLSTQNTKPKGELRDRNGTRVRFAETVLTAPPTNPRGGDTYSKQPLQSQSAGRAPPRSVANYQPPTSFLDAIERPVAESRKTVLDDFLHF